MTTTPIPTGKIRGSLRDVMPKLRNFVGAVKVTTQSGKGGILVDMGKPVASYLTQEGVLHRGKASLELLEQKEIAEFEILRYDEEQFREAMIICDNRGLLLTEEKGAAVVAPAQSRETKPREEENVLSAMMRRFAAPKIGEKQEPARAAVPKAEAGTPVPATVVEREEPKMPEPLPPVMEKKGLHVPEGKEVPASPPQETELSAIIRRLRESGRIEKGSAPTPDVKAEEITPKAGVPEPEWKAKAAESIVSQILRPPAAAEAKPPVEEAGPRVPEGNAPEGRVRVDLGKMMKRIKRLDITSIREELQAGTEGEGSVPRGTAEAPSASPGPAEAPATVPVRAPAPPADAKGKSDIDELKAFIQRLEVLEEPGESPPPGKGLFAKLGVKPRAAEAPAPPRRREIPIPISKREKAPEDAVARPEAKAEPKVPEVREAPRPAEPDRKAKIASLLRRSGLVKPPAEEPPGELISEIVVEPTIPDEKREPAALPDEAEIRLPRPQRKKVEITRVPKRPEKPLREPPLLDERMIQKILKQPGVIAVSTFFEGFAVQSAGRADFEQVAAHAEDLFRAGKKIAREIDIGPLSQIILETGKGKLIIAPYGDLNVCIFTESDANLGLIRVAVKSMQVETG
ncbi:MAG: roadblock/LC7 domain-containing protein [Methanomicrobiales archaeon]|jgi:predicted regulator of Ras-like GTPase activity (Roadblock/LC7/MglB family)